MTSTAITGARILSVGTALPEKVLTNKDLEQMVDTSHEWIVERSGIHERRHASLETASSDLAISAAQKACAQSGVDSKSIDLLILGTFTPDTCLPSTACIVAGVPKLVYTLR